MSDRDRNNEDEEQMEMGGEGESSGNGTGSEDSAAEGEGADNESDNDNELVIALNEGILQSHGINIPRLKKRELIYKKDELETKFLNLHRKRDWLDTLSVKFTPSLCYSGPVDKDFDREETFYKQALNAVQLALPQLIQRKVAVHRPADYFAEMAKGDEQMDRVRRRLLETQKTRERRDQARRLREEKKFAVKVQRSREERKKKERRKLTEATKKHKKGMKGQLEEMLKNAKRIQADEPSDPDTSNKFAGKGGGRGKARKMSRTGRDKKYGFGGQKKRSKRNDKKSFNKM